jgi:hypothetical protein
MTTVAVIGSRKFKNLERVTERLQSLYHNWNPNTLLIISGGAAGVDSYAIDVAKRLGLETKEYKPDMSGGYDVKQYHLRNDRIIRDADFILAFWDGESRGTHSVIQKALMQRKHLEVIFD